MSKIELSEDGEHLRIFLSEDSSFSLAFVLGDTVPRVHLVWSGSEPEELKTKFKEMGNVINKEISGFLEDLKEASV